MNEEEFKEILVNLGYKFDINKREEEFCLLCIKKGFQKGKLEQKKEELRFLNDFGISSFLKYEEDIKKLNNRIKQLQKEIGGMK